MTDNQTTSVLIALGANLGDCAQQINWAWSTLTGNSHIIPRSISRLIATEPVGGPSDQPDYLNAVALFETDIPPLDLLDLLQTIEFQGGRKRHTFWGARTIDLDMLLYGSVIMNTPRLILPHPRMTWRSFVLEPAAEIVPDMIHPVYKMTVRDLLNLERMNFRLAEMSIAFDKND